VTDVLDRAGVPEQPVYRLPPAAYYDPEWYERERRELFGRTWNFVGHVSELAAAGDFLTAFVGTDPVVVVRASDGELRGFVNVCRHRGMVIACGRGNCGESLRCPYHGWEWSFEGALDRVPQRKTQFPDIEPDRLGLLPVAVATWAGFVFVHPDPAAAPTFRDWLGDLPDHCGDYPWDDLVEFGRTVVPLRCNWKLYIENHVDWLHLWYLHQDTLKQYEHIDGSYETSGLHWYSEERLRPGESRYEPAGVQPIPGITDDERDIMRANLLFPNVPFATLGTFIQTFQVVPTGPETSELDIRSYGVRGSVLTDETRDGGLIVLRDEDGRACELMQQAIRSARFEVGPLALEHERPIEDFQRNVLSFLA
jgi:phenylpropionate dioxygenase-like ring-hydroxylating dioxygenase large terminal subunit